MTRPEQLSAALRRLDPRDREVLELSLRRRVPDEALSRVYGSDGADVARRRAAAIERLADDLGIQRGEDLGAVLKALLDPDTWKDAEAGPPPPLPVDGEPVLDMLASERRPRRRRVRAAVMAAGSVAGLGVVGIVRYFAATTREGGAAPPSDPRDDAQTRRFVPQASGPLATPFPTDRRSASDYATAYVRRSTTVYEQPGGKPAARLSGRTEWGSPRVLGVVRRRGRWLAVQAPELRNDEVGWLPEEEARVDAVTYSLHVDLSRRELVVRRSGREVRDMRVAVGSRKHATPTGRFSVTNRLRVTDPSSPYGCCVLALTGHQTKLPPDWPGGDRLAVHATADTDSIGKAISLGCLRTTERLARWLIETVPLGTPVFIRR